MKYICMIDTFCSSYSSPRQSTQPLQIPVTVSKDLPWIVIPKSIIINSNTVTMWRGIIGDINDNNYE